MTIHNSLAELIGNTPLVKLNHIPQAAGVKATIAVKVEYFNPGGSSKDRIAERIIDAAEQSGQLKPGGVIVEPTSGNTGIGLALVDSIMTALDGTMDIKSTLGRGTVVTLGLPLYKK